MVILVWRNLLMNTEAAIRLTNLKGLGKTPTELAMKIGKGSVPYWSDMLNGRKSFGEKAARKIEVAYELPRGYLDESHDRDEALPASSATTPKEIKALEGLYLAIAPEFRAAAIAAATQAMISFLSPHTSAEQCHDVQEAMPSESHQAARALHRTP